MSRRLVIRNRSRYASDDVRDLIKFAVSEIDMRGVCVNVKNATGAFRGMAYMGVPSISDAPASAEYLVTVGIGPEDAFPIHDHVCGHAVGHGSASGPSSAWPRCDLNDWREGLVYVAAHEALHIEQYKERLRHSELACERFAVRMLGRYRLRPA